LPQFIGIADGVADAFSEKIAKQKSCPKIHRPNSEFLRVFAGHARGQQKVDQNSVFSLDGGAIPDTR
jgi:hypothetical protein